MPRNEVVNFLRFTQYLITNVNVGAGTAIITGIYAVGNVANGVFVDLPNAGLGASVSHNITSAETFSTALGSLRTAALAQEGLSLASGDQCVF